MDRLEVVRRASNWEGPANIYHARYKVLSVVLLYIKIFWNVTLCCWDYVPDVLNKYITVVFKNKQSKKKVFGTEDTTVLWTSANHNPSDTV